MFNTLQKQLKLLATDPNDPFTATIRKLVGPRDAVYYERPLRAMILAMPAMIGQIRGWSTESKFLSPIKRLHGFIMAYIHNPEDLLPERKMGFFGYIDDAYLVAKVYQRTMFEADCSGIKRFIKDETIPQKLHGWIKIVKQLLPEETSAMDRLLNEATRIRSGNFSDLLSQAAKSGWHLRRFDKDAV